MKRLVIASLMLLLLKSSIGQVNLQTGGADFKIPIFSYSDQNKLINNISLNYIDGNGLPVNEVASEVGTGWQLISGGVITRIQKGLPDDQKRNPAFVGSTYPENTNMTRTEYLEKYYPNGYLYSAYSPSDNMTNEVGYVRMTDPYSYGPAPEREFIAADREQDLFSMSIEGETVDFVIDKNLQARCLSNEKYKIQFYEENMYANKVKTVIGKFVVTAATGIQYVFEAKEFSEDCTYDKPLNVPNTVGFFDPNIDNVPPFYGGSVRYTYGSSTPNSSTAVFLGRRIGTFTVTKWYLSEIVNPATNKKITFSYEDYDLLMFTNRSLTYYNGMSMTLGREVLKAKKLTKINYPDQSEIDFVYETTVRVDVPNKPLKEIVQKNNGNIISKHVFEYQYFFKSILVPYNYTFGQNQQFLARLCLKSVQKKGNGELSEPPYVFDYYTGTAHQYTQQEWAADGKVYTGHKDIVPPMFSTFTDHWGYYNNAFHPYRQWYYQEAIFYYASTGYDDEVMEAQLYKLPVSGQAKNGILKSVTFPTGGIRTYEYEQNSAYYNGQNIASGGVRVSKLTEYDGSDHLKDLVKEYKYLKEDNSTSSGWGYEPQTYQINRTKRTYSNAQGLQPLSLLQSMSSGTITTKLGTIKIPKGNYFGVTNAVVTPKFLNAIQAGLVAVIIQVVIDLFTNPPAYIEDSNPEYINNSLESANPLPRLYSRVEVIEKVGSTSPNGSTIYEFNSPTDLPLLGPTLNSPYSQYPRFFRGFYGLTKNIKYKDASDNVIREIINTYVPYSINPGSYSLAWFANQNIYDAYPSSHTTYLNQNGNIVTHLYTFPTNYVLLSKTREKIFKPGIAGFTEKLTEYEYDQNNLSVESIKTTDSRGNLLETKNFYPKDYNLSNFPVLQGMVNANMINTLISSEVWKTKVGGTPELLTATVTEYGQTSNGDYQPVKTYALESEIPVAESTIGQFNSSSLIRNTTLIRPKNELAYNANGWPVETKAVEANTYNSFVYGYNNAYQIAEIINAKSSEVAYTSFEENASSGGWTVVNGSQVSEYSVTGKKFLLLITGGTITPQVPMSKNYTLSYWANVSGGTLSVANATSTIIGPSVNGWTYYEYKIMSGAATPVITGLTGTVKIDELRLYPENAQMTTTTYNPGIGKTSECDKNNRIVYYSYDGLGRLSKVFDEKYNLIKTYEYHYKTN